LATAVINVLVASVVIFAPTADAALMETEKLNNSTHPYQLSPIPAGADWINN
jgi:hypothetical protein